MAVIGLGLVVGALALADLQLSAHWPAGSTCPTSHLHHA